MIKDIFVRDVKFTPTQTGADRWMIMTDDGNIACWDGAISEELNKNKGKVCTVDLKQNGNYINIVKFGGIAPGRPNDKTQPPITSGAAYSNNGARIGCAVNNAVALCVAGKIENNMDEIAKAAKHLLTIMKTLEHEA